MSGERAYNIAAIRELLLAAFTHGDLRRFCQDRPAFKPILHDFGPGQSLNDMVSAVIDYCDTRFLWEQFLPEVQQARPEPYAGFESRLFEPDEALPRRLFLCYEAGAEPDRSLAGEVARHLVAAGCTLPEDEADSLHVADHQHDVGHALWGLHAHRGGHIAGNDTHGGDHLLRRGGI